MKQTKKQINSDENIYLLYLYVFNKLVANRAQPLTIYGL